MFIIYTSYLYFLFHDCTVPNNDGECSNLSRNKKRAKSDIFFIFIYFFLFLFILRTNKVIFAFFKMLLDLCDKSGNVFDFYFININLFLNLNLY